jgi:tetratricopeptide (TPR) repeat protein
MDCPMDRPMKTARPAVLLEQAIGLHRAGRMAEAEALYRQVLGVNPRHVDALGGLGLLAVQVGQPAAGLALVDQALALRAGDAELLGTRALALKALGRLAEAIAAYRAALRGKPGDFGLTYNLGNALREAGELEEAASAFRRAIKREPGIADAHNNLGNTLRQLGQYAAAAESFRAAVKLNPQAAQLHFNLGAALDLAGQPAEAEASFRRATVLAPGNAEAWHWLGRMCGRAGRQAEALAAYERALALAPSAMLEVDLGACLSTLSRPEEALPHVRRAVAAAPGDPDTHTALGTLLRDLGDDVGAVAALEEALRLKPEDAGAHYHLGLTHMIAGRLELGWPHWEYRLEALIGAKARFKEPQWRGEAMAGQTLLIHCEQGLGDTLQFCRFVPIAVAASGARVVVEVQLPLVSLIRRMAGIEVVGLGDKLPAFDRQCPMLSLPYAFGTTLAGLPNAVPYLEVDPVRVDYWRARLAGLAGLKVGLIWAGNPDYAHDNLRSIPVEELDVLRGVAGVSWVSLQKHRKVGADGLPPALLAVDWTDELGDVAETGALMQGLDLIVSADSGMVHLAGGLARPVWMINRFDTEWRWFRERTEDSAWYPTLRQFRQQARGSWVEVLGRVRAALQQRVENR